MITKTNNGFKQRLAEASENKEPLKIIFRYPNSLKLTVRKGKVVGVNKNCFDFDDRFDGNMTFSYDFIIEISEWRGD